MLVWPLAPAELYHEVRVVVESPSFSKAPNHWNVLHQEVGVRTQPLPLSRVGTL